METAKEAVWTGSAREAAATVREAEAMVEREAGTAEAAMATVEGMVDAAAEEAGGGDLV